MDDIEKNDPMDPEFDLEDFALLVDRALKNNKSETVNEMSASAENPVAEPNESENDTQVIEAQPINNVEADISLEKEHVVPNETTCKLHQVNGAAILYPFIFPIFFMLMESVARLLTFKTIFDVQYLLLLFTSCAVGFLFSGICGLFKNGVRKIVTVTLMSGLTALYAFLISYHRYFGTFFSWKTSGQAGNVIKYFMENIKDAFLKSWYFTLLIFIPTVAFGLLYNKKYYNSTKRGGARRTSEICSIVGLVCSIFCILVFWGLSGGMSFKSDGYYYKYIQNDINQTYFRYGMFTTSRIEIQQIIFGEPEEDLTGIYNTINMNFGNDDVSVSDEVIDYGYNEIDIDFDAIKERYPKIEDVVEYYQNVPPTNKNSYTGMFKDYNLVFLTLESFTPAVIDPELTPLIYQMSQEGFVFDNFYVPMWSGATETAEYVNLTGNISKIANSLFWSSKSEQTYAMGNVFLRAGYEVWGYHNNVGTFYNRHNAYPALGYVNYRTIDHGMNLESPYIWPKSDKNMAEVTWDDYIHSDKPFHAYYMTISGHSEYTTSGNTMAKWHYNELPKKYEDYDHNSKSYLACQYEVELMLEALVEKLKEEGKYENTVFAMAADHYPYVLKEDSLKKLLGDDVFEDFNLYKNRFIIWCPSMEAPVKSDKYCTSIDIAPTLYNLFGIDYDSRMIAGTDIFSNSLGIALFRDHGVSWKTSQGTYYSKEDEFIPSDKCTLSDDEYSTYVENINNSITLKTNFSRGILVKNYYSYFKDYLEK